MVHCRAGCSVPRAAVLRNKREPLSFVDPQGFPPSANPGLFQKAKNYLGKKIPDSTNKRIDPIEVIYLVSQVSRFRVSALGGAMSFGLSCPVSGCTTPGHPTPPIATRDKVRGGIHRLAKDPRLVAERVFSGQVREPTLDRSKRPGRTMIVKPHGDHKAHGGCCLSGGGGGLEPPVFGLGSGAGLPFQQKPSPSRFSLFTIPATR